MVTRTVRSPSVVLWGVVAVEAPLTVGALEFPVTAVAIEVTVPAKVCSG